jgi:soluble lytic murein transglycosylase
MPILPDYQALGRRPVPTGQRGFAQQDTTAPGAATAQLGQTISRDVGAAVETVQKQDDAQAVFAARRKLDDWERTAIYDPTIGVAGKMGRDALSLPQTVPQEFDKFSAGVLDTLTTPRQRQVFQEMAVSRRDQIADFTARHALTQKEVYETGQYKADIDAAGQRTALLASAGDMPNAAAEVAVMKDRTIGFMRSRGKSEEEIGQAIKENVSKVHMNVVGQMLDTDKPLDAQAYLKANSGDMRIEDLLHAQTAVTKQVDAHTAMVAATAAVTAVRPAVTPTDYDRLNNLVMGAESSGRRYGTDGKLLQGPVTRSGERAQGEMQVMPSTSADPGYGIKRANMTGTPEQQANEIARVGREKLAVMVKRYQGDIPKALAAYNWGEGNVDKAMARAADPENVRRGHDWFSMLPAETQAYVTKIGSAYGQGSGAPAMPTLQDVHDKIRATVGIDRPQRLQAAIAEGTRQYTDLVAAKKEGEAQALTAGMQWLENNGGRFSQMPAQLRNAIAPKDVDNALSYGQKIAKGDDITDPIVFQKMATDDGWLKGLSDAAFYAQSRKLSQSDAQQMATRRGHLLNKETPAGQKPTDLDYSAVNTVLNNHLAQMNLDPTPKDGSPDAQRIGAMRNAAWNYVLQGQLQSGKKFADAEITNKVNELFAKNVKFQTSFLGIGTGSETQQLMRMTASDIPGDTRDKIKADLKKAGVASPTDGDVLGSYLQLRTAQRQTGGATGTF